MFSRSPFKEEHSSSSSPARSRIRQLLQRYSLVLFLFAISLGAAQTTSAQTINYTGPGGTTVTGAGYTIPSPYGSLWTVVDEWGLGRLNDGNPSNNYDEQVVNLGGNEVWRLSNAITGGGFSDQPNSPSGLRVAGESTAFLWNDRGPVHTSPTGPSQRSPATTPFFHGSFRFKSVTGAAQPGLVIPVNPIARQSDRRMVQVTLTDTGTGINISFIEAGPGGLTFPTTTIATGLSYTDWHDIDIYIQFVDGINGDGTGNDIVKVSVNNVPVHVGTSWETYYLAFTPTRPVGAVDALAFRAAGTAVPANMGNGFYFDDVVAATPITHVVDADGQASATDCNAAGTPFLTIQSAITAAAAGDTVKVCPGTYAEDVTLNKGITLNGAQAGIDARGRAAAESIISPTTTGVTLAVGVAGAVVDGFTISGGARGIETASGPPNGLQISNNRIIGFTGNGVFLNDSGTDVTVNQNVIDGASKTGLGALVHLDTDSFNGFHFTNNNIVGKGASDTSTGFFVDGNHNVGPSTRTPLISGNLINGCNTGMNLGKRAFGSQFTPNAGTISNNTFSNSNYDGLQGGIQNTLISGNTFTGNGRSGLALTSFGDLATDKGGQNSVVIGNYFTNNGALQPNGAGISFSSSQAPGTISTNQAHFNRIVGNTIGVFYAGTETINADNNWWGCNYGPGVGGAGCTGTPNGKGGAGAASIDADPWLVLRTAASPTLVPSGGNSTITSDLLLNSVGVNIDGTLLPEMAASFGATLGTVSPTTSTTSAGVTTTTFTAGPANGAATVSTTIDGQTAVADMTVLATCADVSMGTYTPLTNTSIVVPITTSQMTSRGAKSVDALVTFDSSVIQYTGATIGTVGSSNGGSLTITETSPGILKISIYGTTHFQGAGSLVDLNFTVNGAPATTSPLTFASFKYNEGTPCSNLANGSVTVNSGTISGTVTYGNPIGVPVPPRAVPGVTLNAVGSINQSDITEDDGSYSLSGMGAGPYTVTPSKLADAIDNNAISGLDASDIAAHVVYGTTFTASQTIVADVSGNGAVTSYDAAMIATYWANNFVSDPPETGLTGKWIFTPEDRDYTNVNVDYTGQDYAALLMGDVTGNWDHPNGDPNLTFETGEEALSIGAGKVGGRSGTTLTVPVKIGETTGLGIRAYQFELHYDPNVLEPALTAAELAGTVSEGRVVTVNSAKKGILRVVTFGANPLEGAGDLLKLNFQVIGAADSSSVLKWERFQLNEGGISFKTENGEVNVLAAAEKGSIEGQLLDPRGSGVARTRVTITDTQGNRRSVMTSTLGYFQVSELQVGETYTVTAASRRYRFAGQSVSITDGNAVALKMIGLE